MNPKKPNNPETAYLNAEKHYRETGDARYIALAIGKTPENPPQWAIEACQKFFHKSKLRDFSNLWVQKGPPPTDADIELLEKMSVLIADGASVNAAARTVTDDGDSKETDMRRLINQFNNEKWINEQEEPEEQAPRRLERAVSERVKSEKWGKDEV